MPYTLPQVLSNARFTCYNPNAAEENVMISAYVKEALQNAQYEKLEDGSIYGEVSQLPGVLANAATVEACRDQLAEVIEEWILVRVSRRLTIPRLGRCRVQVKRAA